MKKVVLCVPTLTRPYQQTLDSIAASVPFLSDYEHYIVSEVGCPYVSNARATMLSKALDVKADIIVFIDHDVSWQPQDLLKLIETESDVVAGTYRFKHDEVEYMGALIPDSDGKPIVRKDGLLAHSAPAGFLKITKNVVNRFISAYPELTYGDKFSPYIDLFNHGAHKGVWYGEDYAFCRNWKDAGGDVYIMPDLDIDHHSKAAVYPGNYHKFLLEQPGGSEFKE